MRIDPNQLWGQTPLDDVKGATNPSAQPAGSNSESQNISLDSEDTVAFSGAVSQMQALSAQLSSVPEVRTDRVAQLQQQVQQGTYKPSNEQIANAMFSELLGPGGGN